MLLNTRIVKGHKVCQTSWQSMMTMHMNCHGVVHEVRLQAAVDAIWKEINADVGTEIREGKKVSVLAHLKSLKLAF